MPGYTSRTTRILTVVSVAGFLSIVAVAFESEQADAPDYLVLGTGLTRTLQGELSEAVSQGYVIRSALSSPLYVERERERCEELRSFDRERTVDVFDREEDLENCGNELVVLLERSESAPVGREVHLIAALSWKTLAQELSEAGAQGYRLAPRGVLRNPQQSAWGDDFVGREAILLLERSPQTTAHYEYRMDAVELEYEWDKKTRRHRAKNYKELDEQLQQTAREGLRLVGLLGEERSGRFGKSHDMNVFLIWERETSEADNSPPNTGDSNRPRYRVVEGYPDATLTERLRLAAAEGYIASSAATMFVLPFEQHLAIVMKLADDPTTIPSYLALTALDLEGLQNELRIAGRHGYRGSDLRFFGDPLAAIVERPSDSQVGYEHMVFEAEDSGHLQTVLAEAAGQGRIVGVTSTRRRSYGFDEDDSVGGFASLFGSRPSFRIDRGPIRQLEFVEAALDERSETTPGHRERLGRLSALVVEIGKKPDDMAKELNKMAQDRYRYMHLATAPDGETIDFTLRASPEDEAVPEYRVLTTLRVGTMAEELNEHARAGFRLGSGAVFAKPTKKGALELAALMERTFEDVPPYEYRILSESEEAELLERIEVARAEGYEVAARLTSGHDHTVFLERIGERTTP